MSHSRRRFLALLGGGTILAASPGLVRAAPPEPAIAPWFTAGTAETEPRRRMLSYAILAPNPHNRQPWLAQLEGDDAILLRCDLDRRLAETDPFDRQITIGLGAFVELLVLAAAEQGIAAEVDVFPDGAGARRLDDRPVARIRLTDGAASPDPLFERVLHRRSNKAPYDMDRPVPGNAIAGLRGALRHGSGIDGTVARAEVAALRETAIAGMHVEMGHPPTAMESVRLLRLGQAEVNALPDGIDLTGPMIEDLVARGVLTREAVAAEVGDGGTGPIMEQMLAYTIAPMEATPAYLWQTTPGAGRADQIAAGRDYVRVNLAANAAGLALHPQSQTLQEFGAMAALYDQARALTGTGAGTLQMLCRLGYGPDVPPSPRWPVEDKIVG